MSWLGVLLNSAQEDLSEGQWDSKREDLCGVDPQNWGRATTEQAEHTPFTESGPMPTSEKGAHWGCIVICQYSPSHTWSWAHIFKLGIGLSEGPVAKSQTKPLLLTFFGEAARSVLTMTPCPLFSANILSFPGAQGRQKLSGAISAFVRQDWRDTPKYVSHFR